MPPKPSSAGGVSESTANLVGAMMKTAKLNAFQQRQIQQTLHAGHHLPATLHPTSSAPSLSTMPLQPLRSSPVRAAARAPRPAVRSKATIDALSPASRDDYRPLPAQMGVDKERQKEGLADVMAFGRDVADKKAQMRATGPSRTSRPARRVALEVTVAEQPDAAMERLLFEIEQRRAALDAGVADPTVRAQLDLEISQKVRDMEKIHKQLAAT